MPIGIDPKVDFAFKLVFGSPDHTAITIHFLNAVLSFPQPITHVEILNPIQGKVRELDKLAVLDVLATDPDGRRFNIEMQTTRPADLLQRLAYYNCTSYVRQLKSGESYHHLRPAITICVLDRLLFAEAPEYHLSFRLRSDQRQQLAMTDDLVFHFLELPKYVAPGNNKEELGPLEKWVIFLKHASQLEFPELAKWLVDDEYREAASVLKMISETPDEREFYESRRRIFDNLDYQFQAVRDQARKEGREEGRAEGREEGALIGKIQILQQLLNENVAAADELAGQGVETLNAMLAELQDRLRSRGE